MFDAIVVGLGAVGAATVRALAVRGAKVLGIDRYSPPHALGSSHGDTRITRAAIGEGAQYTPLALRSHEIWRSLEAQAGEELFAATGLLIISSPARKATTHVANFFENTLEAARRFGIAHELLDAAAIRRRFPQFNVADNEVGYFEPGAGFLRAEACVRAQLAAAERAGAGLHRGERVEGFHEDGGIVHVHTDRGDYRARQLVLAAGAWLPRFLEPGLARHFTVTRQALFWFAIEAPLADFTPPRFPAWIWELQDRQRVIYGFPAIDGASGGAKVATEQYERTTDAECVDREVSAHECEAMHRTLVAGHLPRLGPRCVKAVSCLYTATRDFHFVLDRHPRHANVIIASPCSGHGFKHSPAIGELVADMIQGKTPAIDIGGFRLGRLAGPARPS
jgi:sarcosine oxidase